MRRLAILPASFALVALLAGCGEDGASAQEVVAAAPAATVEAGTARTTMRVEMSGLAGGAQIDVDMDGSVDFEGNRAEMTIDLADALGSLGVEGEMVVRSIGADVYIQSPLFQGTVAGVDGDTWLHVDAEAATQEQGFDLGELGPAGNGDPRQGLAVLNGVVDGGAQQVGEEEVRGVQATHYRARIDLRRAAERAGDMVDPEAFDRFVETLGSDSIRVDVWVDEDDLVRRVRIPVTLPEDAGGGEMVFTAEYYDFGADVAIDEPDPADVQDLQGIVDQLGTGD